MPFQARVFELAKDTEHPEQYQDAFGIDAPGGIAAVADGVASAIFSRQWAGILAEATISDTPDPRNKETFAAWLAQRRETWSEQIDTSSLAWFQKPKLPTGAFSTLLWVRLLPVGSRQKGRVEKFRLQSFAIGDSCLFHVRRGQVLQSFPILKAEELQADPIVLGSVNLYRDQLLQFAGLDEVCYPDDLIVLCTDAIAEWALRETESGNPPAWDDYWDMSDTQWQDEIAGLREQQKMRYDDATLVLLRVTAEDVEVRLPEEAPSTAEVVEPEVVPDEESPPAEEEDWREKFKSAGEQLAEGIELASDQLVRGWKKWRKKAAEKYRDKFKRDDE